MIRKTAKANSRLAERAAKLLNDKPGGAIVAPQDILPGTIICTCFLCDHEFRKQADEDYVPETLYRIRYKTEWGVQVKSVGYPVCGSDQRICKDCELQIGRVKSFKNVDLPLFKELKLPRWKRPANPDNLVKLLESKTVSTEESTFQLRHPYYWSKHYKGKHPTVMTTKVVLDQTKKGTR